MMSFATERDLKMRTFSLRWDLRSRQITVSRLRTGFILCVWFLDVASSLNASEFRNISNYPLPDDLPTLQWRQRADIFKCCSPVEVLVKRGNETPTCEVVEGDHHWTPQVLNGRSKEYEAVGDRTSILIANITCEQGDFWLTSSVPQERFELLNTGDLFLRSSRSLYPAGGFCADQLLSYPENQTEPVEAQAARVCQISFHSRSSVLEIDEMDPSCQRRTCVRKCCPRGLKLRLNDQMCIPQNVDNLWNPEFFKDGEIPTNVSEYQIVWGNPSCKLKNGSYGKVFPVEPAYSDEEKIYLQQDGRLWYPGQGITLEHLDFCIDQVEYLYHGNTIDYHMAIVCFGDVLNHVLIGNYIYRGLLLASTLFLFLTFLVYVAIPELQNLHGRCLISHVAALLSAYVANLVGQAPGIYEHMAACQATALVMYFCFLAACFWLNVMSFDIWLTFSRMRSSAPNRSKTRRFIKYSLYCWCCPLLLTLVTILMQYAPDSLVPPEDYLRPGFGKFRCWFPIPDNWEIFVYFHIPILVLMSANLVLFILTARNMRKTEEDTIMATKKKTGLERFKLYVHLFIVMGITWLAEAISLHVGPKQLWFVTDVVNSLQGFIIFLLFTLRANSRKIIHKHLSSSPVFRQCCRCLPHRRFSVARSGRTSSTAVPTTTQRQNSAPGQNGHNKVAAVSQDSGREASDVSYQPQGSTAASSTV